MKSEDCFLGAPLDCLVLSSMASWNTSLDKFAAKCLQSLVNKLTYLELINRDTYISEIGIHLTNLC